MALFFLTKAALAFSLTAHLVTVRPPLPIWQVQFVQGFPLKFSPFCKLFAGLSSTKKSPISPLLLSNSRFVLATPSSLPSFLLPQTLWHNWQKLYFLLLYYLTAMVPGHSLLSGSDGADVLARRGTLIQPSAVPCSLSLLSPLVSFLLFSRNRVVVFHLNSSKHSSPRYSLRKLYFLIILDAFSRLCCNGSSVL